MLSPHSFKYFLSVLFLRYLGDTNHSDLSDTVINFSEFVRNNDSSFSEYISELDDKFKDKPFIERVKAMKEHDKLCFENLNKKLNFELNFKAGEQ